MATVYVSQSTANGYAVGNDSNTYAAAQSTSTPWLTIAHAVSACTAGDTIVVNDGTYAENSGSNYLAPAKINLTIQALNAAQVTIQAFNSGAARCLHVASTAGGLVCANLIFDGQTHQAQCVTTDSSNQLTALTFTGCAFKNYTTNGLTVGDVAAFLMQTACTVTHTPTVSGGYGVNIGNATAAHAATDNYTINGCTIQTSGAGPALTTVGAINVFWPNTAGGSVTLAGNTINLTSSGASGTLNGIFINGGPTYVITSNLITLAAPSATASNTLDGIRCQMAGTAISAGLQINANTITLPKGHSAGFKGYSILVGNDVTTSPTTPNQYTNVLIYSNTCNGGFYGVLLNYVTNAQVYSNIIENVVIGAASKLATTALIHDNTLSLFDGTHQALWAHGDTGSTFEHNTVYLDITCPSTWFLLIEADATAPTPSSGVVVTGNSLCSSTSVPNAVSVDATSTATFSANNYSTAVGFSVAAYIYQGTTYTTIALWIAAKEPTATQTVCYLLPPGTTVYVSQSTANGYAVGNDSNTYAQAQSKLTPFLTIDKAARASSPGDTIVINDGIYAENTSAVGYLQVNNGPYTLAAQNALAVTVRAQSAGAARVLHVNHAGQGLSCVGLIFDGQTLQQNCVTTDSSNQLSSLTFTGCTFNNHTQRALQLFDIAGALVSMSTINHQPTVTNAYAIQITGNAGHAPTNNYTVTACLIRTDLTTQSFVAGINVAWPAASGGSVTLTGNTISLSTALSSGTIFTIYMQTPGPAYSITGNILSTFGPSTPANAMSGIELSYVTLSPVVSPSVLIANNTISGPKGSVTGYVGHGIAVGPDADTRPMQANCYQNVVIENNVINGANHGILMNWITGGIAEGNTISNVVIGLVSKLATSCIWRQNILSLLDGTNAALRAKGDQGSVFFGNVVTLDASCNSSKFIECDQDAVTPVGSIGTQYRNNALYALAPVLAAVVVDSVSTAKFAANNYCVSAGFGTTPWLYGPSVFGTLDAWRVDKEPTVTQICPAPPLPAYPGALQTLPRARYARFTVTFPTGGSTPPWARDLSLYYWNPEQDPALLNKIGVASSWRAGPNMLAYLGTLACFLAQTYAQTQDFVSSYAISGAIDQYLQAYGADLGLPQYTGETPQAYRARIVTAFQSRTFGGSRPFIAQQLALLTGFTPTQIVVTPQASTLTYSITVPAPIATTGGTYYPALQGVSIALAQSIISTFVTTILNPVSSVPTIIFQ